jgi:hypothetical protein
VKVPNSKITAKHLVGQVWNYEKELKGEKIWNWKENMIKSMKGFGNLR